MQGSRWCLTPTETWQDTILKPPTPFCSCLANDHILKKKIHLLLPPGQVESASIRLQVWPKVLWVSINACGFSSYMNTFQLRLLRCLLRTILEAGFDRERNTSLRLRDFSDLLDPIFRTYSICRFEERPSDTSLNYMSEMSRVTLNVRLCVNGPWVFFYGPVCGSH
ncbi:uncharacterized protein PV07_04049 [Cladophialophora immunda]|uniref:Uncharacterized protein n=1 Tax=Cladophialophora immunda TaxID=569365 RepID=A0A0D2B4S6_9EURO|nr:uncharacterized protein PV07_04049 [Cladophialophora immunda]KIW32512.1 hypothetical protein PV07_04049 [Cladophialophora immunda]